MITYLAEKETVKAERVGYTSLCGVRGDKFPLNHGNYFSLCVGRTNYEIANFWHEDLEHLLETGVVSFPINIKILEDGWAMIYDERVPKDFYSETSYRAPQEYWSLKQLMDRQFKLDSGEIQIIKHNDGPGYTEKYTIKTQRRKLSNEWLGKWVALEPLETVMSDSAINWMLDIAKAIDSTPIPKYSLDRKEANDRGEFMSGSSKCSHGFESGKDCGICYTEWKNENAK